jgi:N-acetylneuraminate lyase
MVFELTAAVHTPFDAHGELDLEPVARQAAALAVAGVHGVLVAGSTGEGPSLTGTERRRLAERWVELAGSLRVTIQVGHDSPREARALAAHAAEVGAHAVCAAPPSWFTIPSAEALAETCQTIASGAPELPFLYYHIPALSGVSVPMARLLERVRERVPRFAGIKYTHLDPVDFQACVREHGRDVQMLWGCDELLVTGLALGAHGAVGSTYNFAAPLFHALIAAHTAGDIEGARRRQGQAALLVETLARRGYPAAAKSVMGFLGVDCGPTRVPLEALDVNGQRALRAELEAIGFFRWIEEPERC